MKASFGRLLGEERGAIGGGEPESGVLLGESGQGQKGNGGKEQRWRRVWLALGLRLGF